MIRVAPRKTWKGTRPPMEQGWSLSYCPRFAVRPAGREDSSLNRQAAETRSERGGAP